MKPRNTNKMNNTNMNKSLSTDEFFNHKGDLIGIRILLENGAVVEHGRCPAIQAAPAPPTLPSVTMLLIDPMLNYFKWAIVDGNVLRRQGASSSFEGIKEIAAREAIVDVFIYEGYRAKEVREAAAKNGWHCVRVNSTKERGSIALLLDEACNLDVARIRKPSRVDDLLAQVDSLSRELKRQLSVEEIVAAIVQFDTLKEGNA